MTKSTRRGREGPPLKKIEGPINDWGLPWRHSCIVTDTGTPCPSPAASVQGTAPHLSPGTPPGAWLLIWKALPARLDRAWWPNRDAALPPSHQQRAAAALRSEPTPAAISHCARLGKSFFTLQWKTRLLEALVRGTCSWGYGKAQTWGQGPKARAFFSTPDPSMTSPVPATVAPSTCSLQRTCSPALQAAAFLRPLAVCHYCQLVYLQSRAPSLPTAMSTALAPMAF